MSKPWDAKWAFVTAAGVTSGSAGGPVFSRVRAAILKAAEASLDALPDAGGDAMNEPWNTLQAHLYDEAMVVADEAGAWHHQSPDGWADVRVTFNP